MVGGFDDFMMDGCETNWWVFGVRMGGFGIYALVLF